MSDTPTTATPPHGSPTGEEERERAIAELIEALPPHDVLLRWAEANRPPQEWFDEEEDDLL